MVMFILYYLYSNITPGQSHQDHGVLEGAGDGGDGG